MKIICSLCGKEYTLRSGFCNKCGSEQFIELPDEESLLAEGTVLAERFKIIGFLKAGAMSAVYKAEDMNLPKLRAIKEVISISEDEERQIIVEKFEREAFLLSALDHPNLPRVIDYFTAKNRHYLVMDYVDGYDLESVITNKGIGGFPEEEVIEWASQICDILHYLHNRNPPIIYRDLKPSNIMIRKSDKKIILVDFGIARTINPSFRQSLTMTAVGTVAYMSPEQYRGKAEIRSDIYSLGATMHHLLTSQVPMPFTPEPIGNIKPSLSPHIKAIVTKALKIKPSERFDSAIEMKKALTGNIKIEIPETDTTAKLDLILEQLNSQEADMRYIVIRTLAGYKDESKILPPLTKMLVNEPDKTVKREGVKLLSTFKDRRIIQSFNKFITDIDLETRKMAINVLEKFKDPSSTQVLIEALSDKDKTIRFNAAMCLLDMQKTEALKKIIEVMKKETSQNRITCLEKGIKELNPDYLLDLDEENLKDDSLRIKKKKLETYFYAGLFIIIGVIVCKIYFDTTKKMEFNKLFYDGEKYLDTFDFDSARNCFSRALTIEANSPETLYLLGRSYVALDQNKARYYEESALKIKKDYPEALMVIGKIYLLNNNFKEAVTYLEKSVTLKKELYPAYIYLGETYYKCGDITKAEEIFNNSILSRDDYTSELSKRWLKKIKNEKLSPDIKQKIEFLYNQGNENMDKLNYTEAGKSFLDIIRINPEDSRGHLGLAQIQIFRKNFESSLQYLKDVIDVDPICKEAFCNIAAIYIEKNNYDEAMKNLNMARDIDPFYPEIHYLLGVVYYREGKKEEALKEFNIYLNMEPSGKYTGKIETYIKEIKKQ